MATMQKTPDKVIHATKLSSTHGSKTHLFVVKTYCDILGLIHQHGQTIVGSTAGMGWEGTC